MIMEESSRGNDQSTEEKVINILVIQEPPEWHKRLGDESTVDSQVSQTDVRVEHTAEGLGKREVDTGWQGVNSGLNDPLYKGQSFIIDSYHDAAKSSQVTSPMEYTVEVKEGTSSFNRNHGRQSFPRYKMDYSLNSKTEANQRDERFGCEYILASDDVSVHKRVKLGRHKSISFPVQNESFSSSTSFTPSHHPISMAATTISSIREIIPQTSATSLSLPFSPSSSSSSSSVAATLSSTYSSTCASNPETPKISTTPDSGFYTPSQFEASSSSATINPFFTSTPRRSKSAGPQTSTPYLSETPKQLKCQELQQRFTDLCNAMDWDSLDDSGGMSEDPKEGNDSGEGESSPNSSLRSVQWLKGFSIGDSLKPLLSSPPTPGSKDPILQSLVSDPNKSTSHNDRCSTAMTSGSLVSNVPSLTPLPVIMAPRVPTYLQPQCGVIPSPSATSSSSSSSSTSSSSSSLLSSSLPSSSFGASVCTASQDANSDNSGGKKGGQRKALEELKMNKPERNIGRSKYTGKIFTRPGYSYMDLIKMAMQSSEEGEMTLKQIVTWIEDHFPFFKHEAKDSWKSSIRHNLSLHSDFMKADDKKHGCKWKLCDDVAQPSLHVPAPQEMTSAQTAFLKRVKKNAPQPILPKVNAYALVPIHNLTNPVTEASQQQQQLPPPPPQPQPQPLLPIPRKPIHILPKQEGPDSEAFNHHQQFPHQLVTPQASQASQPEQHHVIQQLLQKGPQHSQVFPPDVFDQKTSDYVHNVPAGIFQSLDNGSNQSFGFPSFGSFDQSLPLSSSQYMDSTSSSSSSTMTSGLTVNREVSEQTCNFSYTVEQTNSTVLSNDAVQALPTLQKKNNLQNFPLSSVFEIRQEEGAKPGEKKIVFVLQESEKSRQLKNVKMSEGMKDKRVSTSTSGCNGSSSNRKPTKNLSEIFEKQESRAGKTTNAVKSLSFGGSKKKWKEGHRGQGQRRGPVLNLQSVLQGSAEDKKASDTIGLLLQEEDEDKRLGSESSVGYNAYTRVKSISDRESQHLNSHMQRALQEQTANIMSQIGDARNESGYPGEDGITGIGNSPQKFPLPKAGSQLLPFSMNKKGGLSLRERMGLIKNRSIVTPCDDVEVVTNRSVDTIDELSSSRTQKKAADCQESDGSFSFSHSSTRSASQLVFRRLSSGDQNSMSFPSTDSSYCYSSLSNVSLSGNLSKATRECQRDKDPGSSRRIGNILRSKSRRKQIHVPLTIEISPASKKSHVVSDDEDLSVICADGEKAQFMTVSDDNSCPINTNVPVSGEAQPMSLSTEIRQPSLKILQERPLEQYQHIPLTSLKEKPSKVGYTDEEENISFSDFQMNPADVDKVMENIFTCSGSPVKNSTVDKITSPVFGVPSNNRPNPVDHSQSTNFDTPPSILHFFSTLDDEDNHRAFTSNDNDRSTQRGPLGSGISLQLTPTNDRHFRQPYDSLQPSFSSPSNHLLQTPSPPSRYPGRKLAVGNSSSSSTFTQRKISIRDESRGFLVPNLSPLPPAKETLGSASQGTGNGNNNIISFWTTNLASMDTPPCGTIHGLASASSSFSSSLSSSTAAGASSLLLTSSSAASTAAAASLSSSTAAAILKSPLRPQSHIVDASCVKLANERSNHIRHDGATLISHNTPHHELFQQDVVVQGKQQLPPHNTSKEVQQSLVPPINCGSGYLPSSSLSSSLTSTLAATSLPMDMTVYSLVTPPCGSNNNNSSNSSASTSGTLNGTCTAPLFLSVAGSAPHPLILSPSPSSSSSNHNHHHSNQHVVQHQQQQHAEFFPSFTPESLSSVLDPSTMENLDLFINSLPGLGPGFPSIQLSPHS